jgi:hypothetical protein
MKIKSILPLIQKLVRADKSVVVGLLVQAGVALSMALGFHAKGSAVAVVSTLVNLAVTYFLNRNFNHKLAAAKAPKV